MKKEHLVPLIITLILIAFLLCGCKTRYLPAETSRTEREYIERWLRDSIYIKDSIVINKAGDTVFVEKYKYLYRDKFVRDSIFRTDSIYIEKPYPVEVPKEVNRLTSFQSFQIWCGRLLLLFIVLFFGIKYGLKFLKRKFLS